jgi:hypothetical protein
MEKVVYSFQQKPAITISKIGLVSNYSSLRLYNPYLCFNTRLQTKAPDFIVICTNLGYVNECESEFTFLAKDFANF